MAVTQFTFPQSGDKDDAEHFGSMVGMRNLTDYVETGFTFTYDDTVPEVSITNGKAVILTSQQVASSSGDDILRVGYVAQRPSTTVSLSDNALNYIYLEPNIGSDDSAVINAYTSTQSGNNELLIGTIDTSTDEVITRNRDPLLEARRIEIEDDGQLSLGNNNDYTFEYDSSQDRLAVENDASTRLTDLSDTELRVEVNLDMRDNNIDDVSSIDGGGDVITVNDAITVSGTITANNNIDLSNNNLDDVNSIDGGGDSIAVNDEITANSGINLSNNNLDDVNSIDGGGNGIDLNDPLHLNGNNFRIGASDEFEVRYDSGNDDLRWEDEGNNADRMKLDRTTGDLTIDGTLDETSTL